MRLWHYKLIPVLPKKQLVSQWRECISIKRRWEQNKSDSPLIIYVRNYEKRYFRNYILTLMEELYKRHVKIKQIYINELFDFCANMYINDNEINYSKHYPEHNDRYLKQCYYNLQEKYDRGIITEEEWTKITDNINIDYLTMCR